MQINWRRVLAGCWRQCTSAAWVLFLAVVFTVASYYALPTQAPPPLPVPAGHGGEETRPVFDSLPVTSPEKENEGELPSPPGDQPVQVYFQMTDPVGDDRGPGSYVYPIHRAFAAHDGLFDLTSFQVSGDATSLYFDLTFRQITNPWDAPEGFFHQRVDIYLDTVPRAGRTDTFQEGAYVRFAPPYAWDYLIRVAPWGGSGVYAADGRRLAMAAPCTTAPPQGAPSPPSSPLEKMLEELQQRRLEQSGVTVRVVGGNTIQVVVPRGILGEPQKSWHYYVLVGAYDGFGPDNYRLVMEHAGDWVLGGGHDGLYDPNLLDILAPARGRYSQRIQLSSYHPAKGVLATLYPVGGNLLAAGRGTWPGVILVTVILLAVALAYRWGRPWMQALIERLRPKPPTP